MISARALTLRASFRWPARGEVCSLPVRALSTREGATPGRERNGSHSPGIKDVGGLNSSYGSKVGGIGVKANSSSGGSSGGGGGSGLRGELAGASSPADVLLALENARVAARPLGMVAATMAAHRLGMYKCSPKGPAIEWLLVELGTLSAAMDAQGAANTAWGLAKMGASPSLPLWQKLVQRSLKIKGAEFKPQAISNLMWALATVGVPMDVGLVRVMSLEAVKKSRDFKPQNMANLMWAIASAGVSVDPALVKAMSSEAVSKRKDFNPQTFTVLLSALASFGLPLDAELVRAISSEAVAKHRDFNPQAIVDLVWALATAGVSPDPLLLRTMSAEAVLKCRDFNPQNIANFMWALATLGAPKNVALVRVMSAEAVSKCGFFKPQEITNLMWALATFGVSPDTALVRAMSLEAISKSKHFSPGNIATLMQALATLGVSPDPKLVRSMSSVAISKSSVFTPQDISVFMCALAKSCVPADAKLVQAMSSEAILKISDFKPQEIANLMWALATLGVLQSELIELVSREAVLKAEHFESKDIANLMWALATLGVLPEPTLMRAMMDRYSVADYDSAGRMQLHLFFLFNWLSPHPLDVSSWLVLEAECKSAFVAHTSASIHHTSAHQKEVARALRMLVPEEVLEEQVLEDSGFSVDVWLAGTRVVVEVDGPDHYLRGAGRVRVMDGGTQFKGRTLRQLGWTVLQVPYFEWNSLSNAQDRARYLSTMLDPARIAPLSLTSEVEVELKQAM